MLKYPIANIANVERIYYKRLDSVKKKKKIDQAGKKTDQDPHLCIQWRDFTKSALCRKACILHELKSGKFGHDYVCMNLCTHPGSGATQVTM